MQAFNENFSMRCAYSKDIFSKMCITVFATQRLAHRHLRKLIWCAPLFLYALSFFAQPVAAAVNAQNIGEETAFFVDAAYDLKSRSSIAVMHQLTGSHAYVYVDKTYLETLTSEQRAVFADESQKLLAEFDGRIYPIMTQTFGTPWEPGIDGDPHITILITQLTENAAGYFNPRDEFSRTEVPESNEREMIYVNTSFMQTGRIYGFLAHEFQHLITFYWKDKIFGKSDDVWLNEARSEYVPTLLGYDAVYAGSNLEHRVQTFLRNPRDSLTEWRNTPYDYGSVALLGQYLADQYTPAIFREMMRAHSIGIASVEEALRALGQNISFDDVFANWTIANYLNDTTQNPRYGYINPHLRTFHLPPTDIPFATSTIAFTAKDWANSGFRLAYTATGTFTVHLTSTEAPSAWLMTLVRTAPIGPPFIQNTRSYNGNAVLAVPFIPGTSFLVLPFSMSVRDAFSDSEPLRTFSLRLETGAAETASLLEAPSRYPDGSLIRARGDYKVYITKGQFRRHVVSSDIFGFYGHLSFAQVIEVSSEELAKYKFSAWVRADGDPRVWEINGDGTKHWINIPGEQFAPSGRDWNGVYIINTRERDWYRRGADVLR